MFRQLIIKRTLSSTTIDQL